MNAREHVHEIRPISHSFGDVSHEQFVGEVDVGPWRPRAPNEIGHGGFELRCG